LERDIEIKEKIDILLHGKKWWNRLAAAWALGELNSIDAVTSLISTVLNEDNWKIRHAATWSLGEIGDNKAIPSLVSLLEFDVDWLVRRESAWALGKMGAKEAANILKKAIIERKNERGVFELIYSLIRIEGESPENLKLINQFIKDNKISSWQLRRLNRLMISINADKILEENELILKNLRKDEIVKQSTDINKIIEKVELLENQIKILSIDLSESKDFENDLNNNVNEFKIELDLFQSIINELPEKLMKNEFTIVINSLNKFHEQMVRLVDITETKSTEGWWKRSSGKIIAAISATIITAIVSVLIALFL